MLSRLNMEKEKIRNKLSFLERGLRLTWVDRGKVSSLDDRE